VCCTNVNQTTPVCDKDLSLDIEIFGHCCDWKGQTREGAGLRYTIGFSSSLHGIGKSTTCICHRMGDRQTQVDDGT